MSFLNKYPVLLKKVDNRDKNAETKWSMADRAVFAVHIVAKFFNTDMVAFLFKARCDSLLEKIAVRGVG